jgi:hypothetical protein
MVTASCICLLILMSRLSGTKGLGIDQYGNVKLDGDDIYLTTPRVSMPLGIEIYGDKKVVNFEFLEDLDDDKDTRRFLRRLRRYEQDLESQLDGKFLSSLKDANGRTGMRMRTRLMTASAGTVSSEFYKNGNEVGAYELKPGETGTLRLKLSHVWTMTTNGDDTAGAIWVIVYGELEPTEVDEEIEEEERSSRCKHHSKRKHISSGSGGETSYFSVGGCRQNIRK